MAAEWVNLLRHGVLDADVYPDKATVIIDMLWSATGHAWPKVLFAHLFSHVTCVIPSGQVQTVPEYLPI